MLSKCANPSCSTPFVYLRDGKLFVRKPMADSPGTRGPAAKEGPGLEYFWLCGPCSEDFTVAYDANFAVQVVGKKAKAKRSAA
ncbi:MAG TPA: hypothetical protein VKL40_11815 [Candidatus Angelobacter sp.]|nr:hypothetical protein [Candidatus Angelobacter sp.]